MKSASAGLIAALNGGQKFILADLYTFTLPDTSVLRYAMGEVRDYLAHLPLHYGGVDYDVSSIIIERGDVVTEIGTKANGCELTIHAKSADLLNGTPWLQALRQGALDGAIVQIDTLYMTTLGDYSLGTMRTFGPGIVADVPEIGRSTARLNLQTELYLLNTQLPRLYYQPQCANVLFDSNCALSRSAFAVTSTVGAASTATLINCGLSQVADYFTLGTITFTSGPNSGRSVTVKSYSPGVFHLMAPLLATPTLGDAFTAYPGCPKTKAACENTDTAVGPAFSNVVHFRGQPYVPNPATAI